MAMSDSSEDEARINAILSDDIIHGTSQSKIAKTQRKRNYDRGSTLVAFSLKNAYCVIVHNINFKTEDSEKLYDRKIRELKRFLEQHARFSTVEVYKNCTGVSFLKIFQDIAHNPHLDDYDGFFCFILCDNDAKTPGNVDIDGAISTITKSPQLNEKPKMFFVEEATEDNTPNSGIHNPTMEFGNEFLYAHEKSLLDNSFIARLLASFVTFSDRENILAMIARCSYLSMHTQVYNFSKPVVFANCFRKLKHDDDA